MTTEKTAEQWELEALRAREENRKLRRFVRRVILTNAMRTKDDASTDDLIAMAETAMAMHSLQLPDL